MIIITATGAESDTSANSSVVPPPVVVAVEEKKVEKVKQSVFYRTLVCSNPFYFQRATVS